MLGQDRPTLSSTRVQRAGPSYSQASLQVQHVRLLLLKLSEAQQTPQRIPTNGPHDSVQRSPSEERQAQRNSLPAQEGWRGRQAIRCALSALPPKTWRSAPEGQAGQTIIPSF